MIIVFCYYLIKYYVSTNFKKKKKCRFKQYSISKILIIEYNNKHYKIFNSYPKS